MTILKPHPSLSSPRAQTLIPRLQLLRSCLPLAYLNPLHGRDDLPSFNLFSAHIDVFEEISLKEQWSGQPTVLIAQSVVDDGLFAIERVREGIYAMCRLGSWVTVNLLESVQAEPMVMKPALGRQCPEQPRRHEDSWWKSAAIALRSQGGYGQSRDLGYEKTCKVRLCLQMPEQKAVSSAPAQITQEESPSLVQGQSVNGLDDMVEKEAQDPKEVMKMVQGQYQDSLYTSKARLRSRANIIFFTNGFSSRHWRILRKDRCLELEPLSVPILALPTTICILRLS